MFTFIVLRGKREKKEVEGLTVTSGQWPVKPAPPIIIIMHRDGVILCKAGLRSPAVWGLVSKAYSTTSRKLFRIIHLPKPVYCSEREHCLHKDAPRGRTGAEDSPGKARGLVEGRASECSCRLSIVDVVEEVQRLGTEGQRVFAARAATSAHTAAASTAHAKAAEATTTATTASATTAST